MPLFSPRFRAAAAKRNARLIPFVKIAWPDGTEYYSDRPFGFIGIGPFRPKVISIAEFTFAAGLSPKSSAEITETTIVLEDLDERLRLMAEGGAVVAGVEASTGWAIAGLAEDEWHVALIGGIGKPSYGPGTIEIPLRGRPLRGSMPKAQILQAEASQALEASRGIYHRLLYGVHDASALTGRGMVPAVNWMHAAGVAWRYSLCLGKAKSVDRVYLNGALQATPGDYSVSYPIIGTKQITSIDFVAETPVDAIVTADCQGYETVGDGSGELILNPVEILLHLLTNFAFGDWRYGSWLDPGDAPIDLASFARAASFAATMGFEGTAPPLGGTADPEDITQALQQWLETWLPFRAHWTESGKLGLGAISHLFYGYDSPGQGAVGPALLVRGRVHEIGDSFKPSTDPTVLRRVDLSALYGIQDGKFWTALAVQDVSQPEEAGESFQLFASAAHLV